MMPSGDPGRRVTSSARPDVRPPAALIAVLVFILGLAGLTVEVAVREGIEPLTLLSILVIALFGFGIVGALRHPPDD